jgi:hypothetical protein
MPPTRSFVIRPATDRSGPGPAAEARTANNSRQSRRFPRHPIDRPRPWKTIAFPQPGVWAEGKALKRRREKRGRKIRVARPPTARRACWAPWSPSSARSPAERSPWRPRCQQAREPEPQGCHWQLEHSPPGPPWSLSEACAEQVQNHRAAVSGKPEQPWPEGPSFPSNRRP